MRLDEYPPGTVLRIVSSPCVRSFEGAIILRTDGHEDPGDSGAFWGRVDGVAQDGDAILAVVLHQERPDGRNRIGYTLPRWQVVDAEFEQLNFQFDGVHP